MINNLVKLNDDTIAFLYNTRWDRDHVALLKISEFLDGDDGSELIDFFRIIYTFNLRNNEDEEEDEEEEEEAEEETEEEKEERRRERK